MKKLIVSFALMVITLASYPKFIKCIVRETIITSFV